MGMYAAEKLGNALGKLKGERRYPLGLDMMSELSMFDVCEDMGTQMGDVAQTQCMMLAELHVECVKRVVRESSGCLSLDREL